MERQAPAGSAVNGRRAGQLAQGRRATLGRLPAAAGAWAACRTGTRSGTQSAGLWGPGGAQGSPPRATLGPPDVAPSPGPLIRTQRGLSRIDALGRYRCVGAAHDAQHGVLQVAQGPEGLGQRRQARTQGGEESATGSPPAGCARPQLPPAAPRRQRGRDGQRGRDRRLRARPCGGVTAAALSAVPRHRARGSRAGAVLPRQVPAGGQCD